MISCLIDCSDLLICSMIFTCIIGIGVGISLESSAFPLPCPSTNPFRMFVKLESNGNLQPPPTLQIHAHNGAYPRVNMHLKTHQFYLTVIVIGKQPGVSD